jgi:hypothetical protein
VKGGPLCPRCGGPNADPMFRACASCRLASRLDRAARPRPARTPGICGLCGAEHPDLAHINCAACRRAQRTQPSHRKPCRQHRPCGCGKRGAHRADCPDRHIVARPGRKLRRPAEAA